MTKKSSSSSDSSTTASTELLFKLVWLGGILYGIGFFLYYAYEIRLQAIKEFGPVVHEFDPYFNWRATQVSVVSFIFIPTTNYLYNRCVCAIFLNSTSFLLSIRIAPPLFCSTYTIMEPRNSSRGLTTWFGTPLVVR